MPSSHPYAIGLIGGIACGKSTALDYFKAQDIETFSADSIAKQLTQKGTPFYQAIINHIKSPILTEDNELDRAKLRQLLIHNPEFKQWLERLLHPEIKQQLIQKSQKAKSPYCVLEIPLLQDKATYPLNTILSIESTPILQKQRLALRGLNDTEILGLLNIQTPKSLRLQIADDVIENTGNKEELYKKLEKLHHSYLKAVMVQKTS
jgi:dephospho-CoA kinase